MPQFLNEEEKILRLSRRLLYTSSNYIFVLPMHTCTIGRRCMEEEVHKTKRKIIKTKRKIIKTKRKIY